MFGNLVPFSKGRRDIENLFDKFFQDDFGFFPITTSGIKVDIVENDKEYIVNAEIPGVNKEQININYQQNYLTLSVENEDEIKEEKANYIRKERRSGKMSRSFYIENIQEDSIKAKYENGLLQIILPKDGNAKPKKRISIE